MQIINPTQARELIQKNSDDSNFVILDVRTPDEFLLEHLPNARNINLFDQDFPEKIRILNKDKTYLVHCRSGGRSTTAVKMMEELGFLDVYNVKGYLFE